MKYSELLFGSSEFALRLPNLLLFIVYMIYSYLLFRKTNQFLSVAIFILLCANSSLIDLFGLARGYGLSFGFMLMSLYHFIQSFYNQKTKNILLFHLAALLAILSSFTLLIFYINLLLIYNVVIFVDCKFISNKKYLFLVANKIHAIALLPVIIVLYEPVRRMLKSDYDFGGKNSFYDDTVTSLIETCFHYINISPLALTVLQILFTCIALISFVIILRMYFRKSKTFFIYHKRLIISSFLIIFLSLTIISLHIIVKMDYPIARFSVFLFPIFIIHLGFLISYFINSGYRKFSYVIILGLALSSVTIFIRKTDLYSCSQWAYDMETKNMIQKLISFKKANETETKKLKLGINWIFEPTINFYRETWGLEWLLPVDRNGISKDDNYYYIFKNELSEFNSIDYQIIFDFEKTNTLLLKNKSN